MPTLGVNIDHVATIRQARRTVEPDPVAAAVLAELAGADGITVHLREDRRHIQDRDVRLLRQTVRTHLNLEMAATAEMVAIALEIQPDYITLVPEKREEITTEGGLDVAGNPSRIGEVVDELQKVGCIPISLFIDADAPQLEAAAQSGAKFIELHTGRYAESTGVAQQQELAVLMRGAAQAKQLGLRVNSGHGLTYWNTRAIAAIPGMEELNIGHSIISRAVLVGLERAVREMKQLLLGDA